MKLASKKTQLARVAIVGRPNVGKSALFNRLCGKRISIVHAQPGVTRDRISSICHLSKDYAIELIDTGGIGQFADEDLTKQVNIEADLAMDSADLILFVVDGKNGFTPIDKVLADRLRSKLAKSFLLVNKADTNNVFKNRDDFFVLGFGSGLLISAEHGQGISQLKQKLLDFFSNFEISTDTFVSDEKIKLAIIGRPNVGKSSLLNRILGEKRALVSEIAGTTRDALDIDYKSGKNAKIQRNYLLIDTAGIRRRNKISSSIEFFSVKRAEKSIARADICLLVLDASSGFSSQDKKIARLITQKKKPCLIIFNKYDLFCADLKKSERMIKLLEPIRREFFFLSYANILAISALKNQYINLIFLEIEKVIQASQTRISTSELNDFFQKILHKNPPPHQKGKRLKIFYTTQLTKKNEQSIGAIKILLFINDKNLLNYNYKRFLESSLRKLFPLTGVPIDFQFRDKKAKK